jgi:hypothetical protein
MTVKELRESLEKLETNGHAEDAVTVDLMGDFMRGYNAKVTGIFPGFDWESGQAVIRTDVQLGLYQKPSKRPR